LLYILRLSLNSKIKTFKNREGLKHANNTHTLQGSVTASPGTPEEKTEKTQRGRGLIHHRGKELICRVGNVR